MTTSQAAHRVPGWLLLVGAMSALGPFSIDMYLPGFPAIEREFAESGVERTMATYLFGIAIGQLFYGPLSDRFGRKPPLYAGLLLYSLGAFGCALAANMTMLMSMRVVQAIGACAPLVIGRAVVRDRCEPHEAARAYSMLMLIVSLWPIVGPTLGGWLSTVSDWRAVFVFQGVAGVALVIAMHKMLAESRDPAHVVPLRAVQVARSYARLSVDRAFVGYSLVGGFAMGSLFAFVAGAPIVMTELYALTPQQFGWMIGLNGIAFMSASRLNIMALRHSTPAQVLTRAVWWPFVFALTFVVGSCFFTLPLWLVITLQFLFFISAGRVTPNVAALALAPHAREAGTASALMGALQSAVGMFAGVAVALWSDGTLLRLVSVMALGALCSVLSYLWVGKQGDGKG